MGESYGAARMLNVVVSIEEELTYGKALVMGELGSLIHL